MTRIRDIHVRLLSLRQWSNWARIKNYWSMVVESNRAWQMFNKLTNEKWKMKFKKLTNWCRVQTRAHGCCVEFNNSLQCTNQFPMQHKLVGSTGLSFTEISAFPVFLYKDFFIHQYSLCMFPLIFIRCERGQRLKK